MNNFSIVTTRLCRIGGLVVEPGEVLSLPPAEAQALIDCARAELVDAADAPALRQALADEFLALPSVAPVLGQTDQDAQAQLREIEIQREIERQLNRPKNPIGFIW
jgi:hypothetical protein